MSSRAASVISRNRWPVRIPALSVANVTEEPLSQEFEFGFVLRFAGHAQLDAYHVNPAHLPISLAIRDLSRTVLVFDLAA